ncbi:hypothetical protein TYRP_012437 [Tyrophagus putrescentiae]|nr:hypothetical protein TYRP_012437 [Tyrophagus putrescentiae]
MDPSSHSSLYSLNDALLLTDTGQQHTVSSHSGPAFNIHVLEQLQTAMNRENDRSSELEKELASCKKRLRDLEAQLQAKDDRLIKGDDLHHTHLRTVKDKLLQCLRLMNPRAAAEAAAASSSTFTPAPGDVDSLGAAAAAAASTPTRIIFEHRCDECNFRSKSDVSLILHKMNHSIVEQQFVLSTTAFTTRNSNTKAIYNCPADTHTDEKPLSCPYCEYSFTHQEYLNEHTRTKHSKANLNKNLTIRPDAQLGPLIKESWANDIIANAAQAINQGKVVNNPLNPVATTIITPSISEHYSLFLFNPKIANNQNIGQSWASFCYSLN